MLSYLCNNRCLTIRQLIKLFHDLRSGQDALIIGHRIFLLQVTDLIHPFRLLGCIHLIDQLLQDYLCIADNCFIYFNILIDFCLIYINMDNLGILCELTCITDYTIRESGTNNNQKVCI